MDAFSASLMADKREIIFAPTVYKFQTFAQMAEEFKLNERDVVLTNEFIYTPFMRSGPQVPLCIPGEVRCRRAQRGNDPGHVRRHPLRQLRPRHRRGRGAIMDLCKLLGCKRPDTVHNLYFKRFPVVHEKDVIAIPTTCGTGSECTNISVAIVKDEKDGVLTGGETKLGLVSDDIIPNKVCLIPELLKTLPYKPFACSAIDALVHATESFLSPHRKTMTSELFSEKAMDVILKGFKLIDEKGQDARFEYMDQFVTASFYAGIAFLKAGCGPVHGMSFPLGGTYHVPHGESNYMLFGAIMDYYDEHKPDGEIMKFKELVSSILGCEVKDAIPEMNALLQRILPLRPLRDCGFTEADFKAFPLSVEANQQRLMTNAYYPFDLESEEAIYRKCY